MATNRKARALAGLVAAGVVLAAAPAIVSAPANAADQTFF